MHTVDPVRVVVRLAPTAGAGAIRRAWRSLVPATRAYHACPVCRTPIVWGKEHDWAMSACGSHCERAWQCPTCAASGTVDLDVFR